MPAKQIAIPAFRTEAEEAKWWDSHPDAATEIMKRALKSGKARPAVPLKTVTMRLPVVDLKTAQDLAHRKGASLSDLHKNAAARGPRKRAPFRVGNASGGTDGIALHRANHALRDEATFGAAPLPPVELSPGADSL